VEVVVVVVVVEEDVSIVVVVEEEDAQWLTGLQLACRVMLLSPSRATSKLQPTRTSAIMIL
jgi:hypothetical protein